MSGNSAQSVSFHPYCICKQEQHADNYNSLHVGKCLLSTDLDVHFHHANLWNKLPHIIKAYSNLGYTENVYIRRAPHGRFEQLYEKAPYKN